MAEANKVGRPGLPEEEKAKMVAVYVPPTDLAKLRALATKEARRDSQMALILMREAMTARSVRP